MTSFWVKGIYYELTLYFDAWNKEILGYDLSSRNGDRNTYINGLNDVPNLIKLYIEYYNNERPIID